MLRAAVPAAANLIERTTAYGSEQRFSQLSSLLGDGLIGSVWMYGSEDADTVEASVDVLPNVVRALGVGSTRYLKVSMNTFRVYSRIDQVSGTNPATRAPTPSRSLYEAAQYHAAIVFPSCVGDGDARVCSTHPILEGYNCRRCGEVLGRTLGRKESR